MTRAHRGKLLTVKGAADQLRLHPMTVRKKIDRGQIPAIQLGGPGTAVRIAESELENWLFADVGGSHLLSPPAVPVERGGNPGDVGRGDSSPALAGHSDD